MMGTSPRRLTVTALAYDLLTVKCRKQTTNCKIERTAFVLALSLRHYWTSRWHAEQHLCRHSMSSSPYRGDHIAPSRILASPKRQSRAGIGLCAPLFILLRYWLESLRIRRK